MFFILTIFATFSLIKAQDMSKECVDKIPPDGYECSKQKTWGKCNAYWMVLDAYCERTCGRCMSMEARLQRIVDTALNLDAEQSAEAIAANASSLILQQLDQNLAENFQNFEVSLFLHDVDFLLLMGAAGVLYQQNLQEQCPGGAGPQVRTTSSKLDEYVLAVQLDAANNQDARFILPVVTECPNIDGISETRFEILQVEATFPKFVNNFVVIYGVKIRHPNDGTI
eukprot:TRINITY_DN4843_c0_g1_i1.p1 TRINITY_DN4843_c0_g1~~TRINITY_DN4843_c0_g1_i1.p1  ORF type:complete len:226 (-),score=29.25 TRINITY_DN4843_c0_g1_i1:462-1139(-)